MRTPGSVNVVVSAVKAKVGGINPPLERDENAGGCPRCDSQFLGAMPVFRPPVRLNGEITRWEPDDFTMATIDVWLEEQIGSEAAGLVRMDVSPGVSDQEPTDRGSSVMITHFHLNRDRWGNVEENGCLPAKSQVLVSLAQINPEGGFAFARLRAEDQPDDVLDFEARQFG